MDGGVWWYLHFCVDLSDSLSTFIYHGENKKTPVQQLVGHYDVIITNYHTVGRNFRCFEKKLGTPGAYPRPPPCVPASLPASHATALKAL
jgi:hypothetical protein